MSAGGSSFNSSSQQSWTSGPKVGGGGTLILRGEGGSVNDTTPLHQHTVKEVSLLPIHKPQ